MRPQPLRSPPRSRPARGPADRPPSGPASHTGGLNSGLMFGGVSFGSPPARRLPDSHICFRWLGVACLRLPPPVPTRGRTPPDMSWDVMFCHARGPHGAAGPGLLRSSRSGVPGIPSGFSGLRFSGIGLSSRSVFASFSPPPGAGPHYAARNRARAGGRVGAGAVRAPDCAHARARAQGAPLLPAPSVVFRAGAGAGGSGLRKPLPVLFCFHSITLCRITSPPPIFFHNFLS